MFTYLTNRMDLSAQTICDLYKARWKVELFFKTMKTHLKIRKFLGTSYHAVKAQVLVALIAYLLAQPFALGGGHTVENLHLLCSAHHGRTTEEVFGPGTHSKI